MVTICLPVWVTSGSTSPGLGSFLIVDDDSSVLSMIECCCHSCGVLLVQNMLSGLQVPSQSTFTTAHSGHFTYLCFRNGEIHANHGRH
jgi:hypothetical protein